MYLEARIVRYSIEINLGSDRVDLGCDILLDFSVVARGYAEENVQ